MELSNKDIKRIWEIKTIDRLLYKLTPDVIESLTAAAYFMILRKNIMLFFKNKNHFLASDILRDLNSIEKIKMILRGACLYYAKKAGLL
jgi:hypothetical protein